LDGLLHGVCGRLEPVTEGNARDVA
jgi:hypothetical protein